MKKLLLLLIIPFLSFGQDLTYVPDDVFEEYIETTFISANNGVSNDNYVLTDGLNLWESNLANVLLDPQSLNGAITDLTGIEDFKGVKFLYIDNQLISNLNLSNVSFREPNGFIGAYTAGIHITNNPYLTELIMPNDTIESFLCEDNIYLNCINFNNVSIGGLGWFILGPSLTSLDFSMAEEIFPGAALYIGTANPEAQINLQHPDYIYMDVSFMGWDYPNCIQVDDVFYADNMWYLVDNLGNSVTETDCYDTTDCGDMVGLNESPINQTLLRTIDILGRETTNNKGFQLHIYDDGSVEKKYLIK